MSDKIKLIIAVDVYCAVHNLYNFAMKMSHTEADRVELRQRFGHFRQTMNLPLESRITEGDIPPCIVPPPSERKEPCKTNCPNT